MWWDADTIDRSVTRQFVCSHLLPDEIARLDRPLGFGDGLTDGTYWEWIDEKAKKIFLILVDLGVPDQIFGVIDDSWDDEDLPIPLEHVQRLALTPSKDERLERKFFHRQFYYLLTTLEHAQHLFYHDSEVVPLDVVDRKPGSSSSTTTTSSTSSTGDRVVLPNYPGQVFMRRRIPLAPSPESAYGQGYLTYADFQYEVDSIRNLQNDHFVSYWASYVHQGYGYVLFTPVSDGSLKSLLATTPASVKSLSKTERRQLILDWIHCLVDTLCFLHVRGLSHGNIKPSTVLVNHDNHIFFSDFTHLSTEMARSSSADKASFDKESYDYAAPEQWHRPSGSGSGSSRKSTLTVDGAWGRGGAARGVSVSSSSSSIRNSIVGSPPEGTADYAYRGTSSSNPQLNPQAADVFSLGCIVLELLSFMLKRQTRAFATHRAAKHKTPGRGGAVLDSSFHKNLGQVESWMAGLARETAGGKKKDKDDSTLAGVAPLLQVVECMLASHAGDRPSALEVQTSMYHILREHSGITEPHCVHQYGSSGGDTAEWDSYSLQVTTANYSYPITSDAMSPRSMSMMMMGGTSPSANSYCMDSGSMPSRQSVSSQSGSSSHHGQNPGGRYHYHSRASSQSGRSIASASTGGSGSGNSNGNMAGGVGSELSNGLLAIRNLQIRDKVRQPWNGDTRHRSGEMDIRADL